jgi:hypothetical protein
MALSAQLRRPNGGGEAAFQAQISSRGTTPTLAAIVSPPAMAGQVGLSAFEACSGITVPPSDHGQRRNDASYCLYQLNMAMAFEGGRHSGSTVMAIHFASEYVLRVAEKSQHSIAVSVNLLDVGQVRGGQFEVIGAGDLLVQKSSVRWRGGLILRAGDDQGRLPDGGHRLPLVHIAHRGIGGDVANGLC